MQKREKERSRNDEAPDFCTAPKIHARSAAADLSPARMYIYARAAIQKRAWLLYFPRIYLYVRLWSMRERGSSSSKASFCFGFASPFSVYMTALVRVKSRDDYPSRIERSAERRARASFLGERPLKRNFEWNDFLWTCKGGF